MCKQRKVQQPTDTSHLTKQNNICNYQTLHGVYTGDFQDKQAEIFTQFLIIQTIMNPVPNLHDTNGQQTKTQTRALYTNKNSKLTSWSNVETT